MKGWFQMVKLIIIWMITCLIITICSWCIVSYLIGRTKEFNLCNKKAKKGDTHIGKSN